MKNRLHQIMFTAGFAALASLTTAPAVHAAGGAASASVTALPALPLPPPRPVINTGITSTSSAAVAGNNGGGAVQNGTSFSGSPVDALRVNLATNATAQGQAGGLSASDQLADQNSATVNTAAAVKTINEAALATRTDINASVRAGLDDSARVVREFRAKAEKSGEKIKAAFMKADAELRLREQDLRASLEASGKATKEESWQEARAALARNYEAYAQAMVRAEAAANGSVDAAVKS